MDPMNSISTSFPASPELSNISSSCPGSPGVTVGVSLSQALGVVGAAAPPSTSCQFDSSWEVTLAFTGGAAPVRRGPGALGAAGEEEELDAVVLALAADSSLVLGSTG